MRQISQVPHTEAMAFRSLRARVSSSRAACAAFLSSLRSHVNCKETSLRLACSGDMFSFSSPCIKLCVNEGTSSRGIVNCVLHASHKDVLVSNRLKGASVKRTLLRLISNLLSASASAIKQLLVLIRCMCSHPAGVVAHPQAPIIRHVVR